MHRDDTVSKDLLVENNGSPFQVVKGRYVDRSRDRYVDRCDGVPHGSGKL